MSSRLPKPLKGRFRRAATAFSRSGAIQVQTAWGLFPLNSDEVRLLAPYADEPLELALLARYLRPGMIALDVGANRGSYSLMFSARVGDAGQVIAVEPDPRMLGRLEELRSLNNIEHVMAIVPAALAGESGERLLHLSAEPSLNHLGPATEAMSGGPGTTVTVLSYQDLVTQCSLDRVDLLKVDVEGAEPEVLASVIRCKDQALLPGLIMFEYEQNHWERMGYLSFASIAETLVDQYELYAIDYASGRPIPIVKAKPVWTGRNVLAVRRTGVAETLARLVFQRGR